MERVTQTDRLLDLLTRAEREIVSDHSGGYDGDIDPLHLYIISLANAPRLSPDKQRLLGHALIRKRKAEARIKKTNGHLSREERAQLAKEIAIGERAEEILTISCLPLVIKIATSYSLPASVERIDLIQEGNLGLLRAVSKYNPKIGALSTYAMWWIRQAILKYLHGRDQTMYIPVHAHEQQASIINTISALTQKLGRKPTINEISDHLGMPSKKVKLLLLRSVGPVSLDRQKDPNTKNIGLYETVPSGDSEGCTESTVHRRFLCGAIREILDAQGVNPILLKACNMYFNLDGKGFYTYGEIGQRMGISRETVRLYIIKALQIISAKNPQLLGNISDIIYS